MAVQLGTATMTAIHLLIIALVIGVPTAIALILWSAAAMSKKVQCE